MHESVEPYIGTQLTLFGGGYESVTVEITAHLTGREDLTQFGFVLRDTATTEWLGAMVWTEPLSLQDPREVAEVVTSIVRLAHRQLRPF